MPLVYLDQEYGLDMLSMDDQSLESDLFVVTFAFYKAMAQNIILAKDRQRWRDFQDLSNEDTKELIVVATRICQSHSLTNITLSVHLGGWRKRDDCFHAHLCYGPDGKERYLQIFDRMRFLSPMCEFWPDEAEKFVSKWWSIKDGSDYNDIHARNVHYNPKNNYVGWDKPRIDRIQPWSSEFQTVFEGQNLIYHQYKPQISLPVPEDFQPNDPCHLARYMKQLMKLGDLLLERVAEDEDEGCHLCVSISGEEFAEFKKSSNQVRVFGYILVSGLVFYKVHPRRDEWFERYKHQWDGRVYT